jgi:hypothetical protein
VHSYRLYAAQIKKELQETGGKKEEENHQQLENMNSHLM